MKKILLLLTFLTVTIANSQVVVFEDDFESYADFEIGNFGDWTQVDSDGVAAYGSNDYDFANEGYTGSAIIFNTDATAPASTGTAWDAHSGTKGLYFFAATTPTNDDYVISPHINLWSATGTSLSLWVKTLTATWGLEQYEVLLSTTGNAISDFTVNLSGGVQDAPDTYTQLTYDLSAYDGQLVYIAIHYVGNDTFVFQVDDFSVTAQAVGGVNDSLLNDAITIYPNVVEDSFAINNASNLGLTSINVFDINGRVVKSISLDNFVGRKEINVSNLSSGVYLVEVNSNESKVVKKFIKR